MTIRAMHMEDYDAVYALWLESTGMGLNDYDDSREGIGRYLRRNPESCFVAEDDGAIVGAVLAGHDGRRGHLNHLAVAPERRRQGLGRALVATALAALRRQGIAKVNLTVFAANDEGNAFWEKLGFTTRPDLTYRNRVLRQARRHDT